MAHIEFEKLSEHSAEIRGTPKVLWRIRELGSLNEFYLPAEKAHKKLGPQGSYWCDSRYLIDVDKVHIAEPFSSSLAPQPVQTYQQLQCGHCGQVNSVNIDRPMQGAHYCKRCNGTICVITGTQLVLKNGTKAGQTETR